MKNKRGIYILALILSLATVVLLSMYIRGLKATPETVVRLENVIVAVADIPAQTKITEEMLTTQALPPEAIHPLAVRSKDEIVDSYTLMNIAEKEQLLKTKVALDEVNMALSFKIPEGMRAIAIPTDEILGVGGYLEKEDRVDLLISYELKLENEEAEAAPPAEGEAAEAAPPEGETEQAESGTVTITQMQNIEVLEVGPLTINEQGIPVKSRGVTSSVILLVLPDQAEMLAYAVQTGTIQMSMRNPEDQEVLPMTYFDRLKLDEWRTE